MKKPLLQLLPFGIATLLVLFEIIETVLTPGYVNEDGIPVTYSILDDVLYAGLGLIPVLILILLKKPIWKYLFALLALAAQTPWIQFYSFTFSIGIGFISFELTALGLLSLHLILNPEVYRSFMELVSVEPESETSKKEKFESSVNGFLSKFSEKSIEELETIVEENSRVPAAVEAARRLLQQHKQN